MQQVNFTVRLRGESANILNKIVSEGYCASKTEAVRAALLHYALEFGIVSKKALFKEIQKQVSSRGYSEEEIEKQIASIKSK